MTVINLAPAADLPVAQGMITGRCHVYRMGGYDNLADVAWAPDDGPVIFYPLRPGETATIAVNGQAGEIANLTPSVVQVLYDNAVAELVSPVSIEGAARKIRAAGSIAARTSASSVVRSAGQEAMDKLSKQYYNAIIQGCHLDANTFQLMQGNTPIGTTSEMLWNMFDTVPPLSVTNFFNPGQFNVFSSDYGAVVNNLKYQNGNKFQDDMGDYYSAWTAYLKTSPAIPNNDFVALFQTWAQMHLSPDMAAQCTQDLRQISQGAVPSAVKMWLDAGGMGGGTKAYTRTIAQLQSALASAQPGGGSLNTATSSSDISHSWAKQEAAFLFDLFEVAGDGNYDNLSARMLQSGLSVNVSFEKLVTFAARPLYQPSTDPILSQYEPWFNSAALSLAYSNNNNTVWNSGAPTWAGTFGPNGNMLRTISALVIVDGITVETISNNSVQTDDQTQIQAAAEGGVWPFYEAAGVSGFTHDVSFSDSGVMTMSSKCPTGNPQILGAIVTPISGILMPT